MIVARIVRPGSKLATARALDQATRTSTLGQLLELEEVNEDDFYDALDWLLKRQDKIERRLARRHLDEGTLVLYDVTSSYYTGRCCPQTRFGHSRPRQAGLPLPEDGGLEDSPDLSPANSPLKNTSLGGRGHGRAAFFRMCRESYNAFSFQMDFFNGLLDATCCQKRRWRRRESNPRPATRPHVPLRA